MRTGRLESSESHLDFLSAAGTVLRHLRERVRDASRLAVEPVREVLRVAEHGDGWGVPADWE